MSNSSSDTFTIETDNPDVFVSSNKTLSFRQELEVLINMHSKENDSNTPDWILADYLAGCLKSLDETINKREVYYGREIPSQNSTQVA